MPKLTPNDTHPHTEERWYDCEFTDLSDVNEPDWSKIPEARRETVRGKWAERAALEAKSTVVKLWGPQIDLLARHPGNIISVVGPSAD